MELKLLAALAASRESYSKLKDYLTDEDFSPQALIVWAKIKEFYETDPGASRVDMDLVLAKLERDLANPKHFEMFRTLVSSFPKDVSSLNVTKEFIDSKKYNIGIKLSHALASGERESNIRTLVDDYLQYLDAEDLDDQLTGKYDVQPKKTVRDLIPALDDSVRIPLYPSSLNDRVGGGAVPGHMVFIFGRPEIGKTLNALNLARRPCKIGKRGIYFGNEDPMDSVIQRAVCSFSGLTWEECLKDPEKADTLAEEAGLGNLTFVALYPGSVSEIRELVHEHRPDFFILDQITNITSSTGKADAGNFTLQLGSAMRGLRNIAKRYHSVGIAFAQAGDSAEGKLVLDMGDVDWSNTAMQAACDVMIGVGMDKEYEARDMRMFSLCKNKISGNHDYFGVAVDRKLSRVRSL